ncbi:hypothetical protein [Acinetobacter bereziniae]|uniref:hypothetical protein n=1 Tax=Acinetobacter bereziniae TaxID=106648 RepID=UPI0015DA890D|nr:hypothetical protein [Acinetobacter bereziniae]
MDKCREAFEQTPEIKDSLSENIVFVGNKYTTANEGFYDLVNWLNDGWYTYQSRQAEIEALKNQLIKAGFTDRGGQLLVPPQGKPPRFDLLDVKQAEINKLQSQINEMAQVGLGQESALREKDNQIEAALSELESLHNKKWAEWKEQADMHSQGEANAYEHAMQILEKTLRGEHANS